MSAGKISETGQYPTFKMDNEVFRSKDHRGQRAKPRCLQCWREGLPKGSVFSPLW